MRHIRRSLLWLCCLFFLVSLCGIYTTLFTITQTDTSSETPKEGLTVRHLLTTKTQKPSNDHQATSTQVHTSYIKLEGADSTGHDMFVVYAASVNQLKVICTALPECEGFNTEGWVKSRVSNKRRASIDLYLKQTAVITPDPLDFDVDQSAGIFQKHLDEYNTMEQSLQIYTYQVDIGLDMPSFQDYKYGVEYLFISLLAKSKFRTTDPVRADLFLLPSRCTAYRKSTEDLAEGIQVAGETTSKMVEFVRENYPYWNASLGSDHFYICAHDMGTEVANAADLQLWKNAIGLVNTADYHEQTFVPHKDISLPPHSGRGTVDWAVIGQGGVSFDPKLRTKLAFLAGHPGRGPVRPKIYELFDGDMDFHLVRGYIGDEEYITALKTTKFCLCPRGNEAWSPRLMDALWFGCVPVFISDHYVPPLIDLIQWDTISVTISEKQVSDLKRILLSIHDQKIRKMQLNIQKVYKHLTWNDPPQPYDAFHAVLFELWQKRHVRRIHQWQLLQDSVSYPLL